MDRQSQENSLAVRSISSIHNPNMSDKPSHQKIGGWKVTIAPRNSAVSGSGVSSQQPAFQTVATSNPVQEVTVTSRKTRPENFQLKTPLRFQCASEVDWKQGTDGKGIVWTMTPTDPTKYQTISMVNWPLAEIYEQEQEWAWSDIHDCVDPKTQVLMSKEAADFCKFHFYPMDEFESWRVESVKVGGTGLPSIKQSTRAMSMTFK